MAVPTPPPPPPPISPQPYAPYKMRPSIVTKYAAGTLISGIILLILGVWDIVAGYQAVTSLYGFNPSLQYATGAFAIVVSVYLFICSVGMFMGKSWSMKISGYSMMGWSKRPEVVSYFGLPPAYPTYPPVYQPGTPPFQPQPPSPPPPVPAAPPAPPAAPAAPAAPTCPTCGQPLTYVQQYQRWYCQNEKKYV